MHWGIINPSRASNVFYHIAYIISATIIRYSACREVLLVSVATKHYCFVNCLCVLSDNLYYIINNKAYCVIHMYIRSFALALSITDSSSSYMSLCMCTTVRTHTLCANGVLKCFIHLVGLDCIVAAI